VPLAFRLPAAKSSCQSSSEGGAEGPPSSQQSLQSDIDGCAQGTRPMKHLAVAVVSRVMAESCSSCDLAVPCRAAVLRPDVFTVSEAAK
jgi:hypothetical protein